MRLIGAELLKIWTAPRTLVGLLLAELAIVAIGTASTLDTSSSGAEFGVVQPNLERDLIGNAVAALVFALILGILIVTWEYRHGTITQTFLATPVRERVIAAKIVVGALAGAALTVPALALMFTIAEIWRGEDLSFGAHEWRLIAQLVLTAALVGILGVSLGASSRRQLGAMLIAFVWLTFVEPALSFWASLGDYLPIHALTAVLGMGGEDVPSFWRGLLVSAAYLVGLGAAAFAITRRRDIT